MSKLKIFQVDQKKIFHGLRMKAPRNSSEITRAVSDYFRRINDRKNVYGLNERLLDEKETELRKQSFPKIIEGIWPEPAVVFLEKKWKQDARKWTLMELLKEIRSVVQTYGPYELMRSRSGKDANRPDTADRVDNRPKRVRFEYHGRRRAGR